MLAPEIVHLNVHVYVSEVLIIVYALSFSSIFVIFLPRLAHEESPDKESAIQKIKVLNSMELIGFVAVCAMVGMSWNKGVDLILPVYWALLAAIIHLELHIKKYGPQFLCC